MNDGRVIADGLIFNEEIQYFSTDAGSVFTGAIVAGAMDLASTNAILAYPKIKIVGVNIVSVQNLPWRLWFWGDTSANAPAAPTQNAQFMGSVTFDASAGYQIGGAGNFFYTLNPYQVPGLSSQPTGFAGLFYVNMESVSSARSFIRLGLQPLVVGKLAGAAGNISVKLMYSYVGRLPF